MEAQLSRAAIKQQMRDIKELFDEGILSQSEYQAEKKELLQQLRQAPVAAGLHGGDVFGTEDRSVALLALPSRGHGGDHFATALGEVGIAARPEHPELGTLLLERYRIEGLLGEGGMGQVFLCTDTTLHEACALKRIHPMLAKDPQIRQRFFNELKLTRRLAHPGIVRAYTLLDDKGSGALYFSMEYVAGVTLEQKLQEAQRSKRVPPMEPEQVLSLLLALSPALEYAHSQGVVHRDLKPSNVMLLPDGRAKLMDFGIAKALSGTHATQHTGLVGTMYYMSPEQLRGSQEVTPAADVFSLGVMTYQLLTGEIPMGHAEPPSALVPSLPEAFDGIVQRAMAAKVHSRYPDVASFLEPLEQAWDSYKQQLLHRRKEAERKEAKAALEEQRSAEEHRQFLRLLREAKELAAAQKPRRALARLKQAEGTAPGLCGEYFVALRREIREQVLELEHDSQWPQLSAKIELQRSPLISETVPRNPTRAWSEVSEDSIAFATIAPPKGIERKIILDQSAEPLLEMVRVPGGEFCMGADSLGDPSIVSRLLSSLRSSDARSAQESPARKVYLDSYWIARTPVTNRMWQRFLQESGYRPLGRDGNGQYLTRWGEAGPLKGELEHPVTYISFLCAWAFCDFYGLMLPTEAQWEKAAKGAGRGHTWPWGEHTPDRDLCHIHGSEPVAVGQYPLGVSPYGLFDCAGNVAEWCADRWDPSLLRELYDGARNPMGHRARAPGLSYSRSASPRRRSNPAVYYSCRGGSYQDAADSVRCASRDYYAPRYCLPHVGFRPALPVL